MVRGEGYTLIEGDCLEVMAGLDGPVDAIIADLPYGTTQNAWDVVIPLPDLWAQFKRLIKPNGAIVLFGSQPFTSELVISNRKWFKQEIIWDKVLSVGFLDANRRHLRQHENILLFSPTGYSTYNPQMTKGKPYFKGLRSPKLPPVYGHFTNIISHNLTGERYPTSIVKISNAGRDKDGHSTQKPVDLLAYLIRTYTNPGETVLDCTCGSGTTIVAAIQEGRQGIGIELDSGYFDISVKRCADAARAARGLPKQLTDTRRHDDLPLFMEASL